MFYLREVFVNRHIAGAWLEKRVELDSHFVGHLSPLALAEGFRHRHSVR